MNLLSVSGLQRMVLEVVRNFLAFPPLGVSLTALLGIGTLISTMLAYSVVFLIGWQAFLVIWILLGLSRGPAAPLFLAR